MNDSKNNIATNLRSLRTRRGFSQAEIAEQIGVTRQAVAKWENGGSLPDILNCEALADLFDVSLNELVRYDPEQEGIPIGPKDKHIFGTVTIGERGQIVLPKKARDTLKLQPGDTLVVLGDSNPANAGTAVGCQSEFVYLHPAGCVGDRSGVSLWHGVSVRLPGAVSQFHVRPGNQRYLLYCAAAGEKEGYCESQMPADGSGSNDTTADFFALCGAARSYSARRKSGRD